MRKERPVQEIVLSENHKKLRIVLFVLVLALALTAFTYGIYSLVRKDPGWREVTVKPGAESTCAGDFQFQYKMGSGAAEYKRVQQIYTDACEYMEAVFSQSVSVTVPGNLHAVNASPNEEVTVDPVLYDALAKMQSSGRRTLYLAPIYDYYDNLFQCNDEWETESFDPFTNPEVAETFEEICAFIGDPAEIDLQLLGDNTVLLHVSEDYLAYGAETGIENWIDFYWMKNAFILDYIADTLIQEGFTAGYLTSAEGYSASLGDCGETYSTSIYDLQPEGIYAAAVLQYTGACRVVAFHDYTTKNQIGDYFFMMSDGTSRTPYIDPYDGFCKAAIHDFLVYSNSDSCADLLLAACPCYISDAWSDPVGLPGYVYCQNRVIYHQGFGELTQVFEDEEVVYQVK